MRLTNKCLTTLFALTSIGCSGLNASGLVDGFNVVTLGKFSSQNGDLQGTLAVGGNLVLQNYSLNQSAPVPNTSGGGYDTVAAGNFSLAGGTLYGTAHSASASFTNATVCNGCSATGSSSPVDFTSVAQSARATNSFLYHLTPTGTATTLYSALVLNASGGASLQVFSITSAELSNNAGIDITNLDPSATVVINVTDSGSHSATTSAAGLAINHNLVQRAGNVLFNFGSGITDISLANSFYASLLAPSAHITGGYGAFNGDLLAGSYSGSNQFNLDGFSGTHPTPSCPTPEPSSIGMIVGAMFLGLGIKKFGRLR